MNSERVGPPASHGRILSWFDARMDEPVWRRALIAYLCASSCLWTVAGLVHEDHGLAAPWFMPAFGVPFLITGHAVASMVREVLNTPLYLAALAGVLFAVSRLRPGTTVSFRQLFSVTVRAAYVLLAGHTLRVVLSACGVELSGAAALLLPDPNAMFLPDSGGSPSGHDTAFSVFGSPADIPSVGAFDTAFHTLLGVAYCRLRGGRLITGALWGAGLSLLVDVVWLLLTAGT